MGWVAAPLCTGGQARPDPAPALRPRQAIQARQQDAAEIAHLSRPRDRRYRCKIEDDGGLEAAFAKLLPLARRVREQQQHQRGPKVYSLHARELECIGKGKALRSYEFGVKFSVATMIDHAKGGQFVTHVKALPGNPYDRHTLASVIPDIEALVGNTIARILADKATADKMRRLTTISGSSSRARSEA